MDTKNVDLSKIVNDATDQLKNIQKLAAVKINDEIIDNTDKNKVLNSLNDIINYHNKLLKSLKEKDSTGNIQKYNDKINNAKNDLGTKTANIIDQSITANKLVADLLKSINENIYKSTSNNLTYLNNEANKSRDLIKSQLDVISKNIVQGIKDDTNKILNNASNQLKSKSNSSMYEISKISKDTIRKVSQMISSYSPKLSRSQIASLGVKGSKGDKGDKGQRGLAGQMGLPGPRGIKGEKGDKGLKGDKGPKGDKGLKGDKGRDGKNGKDAKNMGLLNSIVVDSDNIKIRSNAKTNLIEKTFRGLELGGGLDKNFDSYVLLGKEFVVKNKNVPIFTADGREIKIGSNSKIILDGKVDKLRARSVEPDEVRLGNNKKLILSDDKNFITSKNMNTEFHAHPNYGWKFVKNVDGRKINVIDIKNKNNNNAEIVMNAKLKINNEVEMNKIKTSKMTITSAKGTMADLSLMDGSLVIESPSGIEVKDSINKIKYFDIKYNKNKKESKLNLFDTKISLNDNISISSDEDKLSITNKYNEEIFRLPIVRNEIIDEKNIRSSSVYPGFSFNNCINGKKSKLCSTDKQAGRNEFVTFKINKNTMIDHIEIINNNDIDYGMEKMKGVQIIINDYKGRQTFITQIKSVSDHYNIPINAYGNSVTLSHTISNMEISLKNIKIFTRKMYDTASTPRVPVKLTPPPPPAPKQMQPVPPKQMQPAPPAPVPAAIIEPFWVTIAKNGQWQGMPGAAIRVAIGVDNCIWCTNASGTSYRSTKLINHNGPDMPIEWKQMPGTLKEISVQTQDSAVCVGTDNNAYYWDSVEWKLIANTRDVKSISIGEDGTIVLINFRDEIWRYNGTPFSWSNVPGGLVRISVANKNLYYGVNKYDDIYKWTGSSWSQIPGKLTDIAVNGDGTRVLGVNRAGNIFIWNNTTSNWILVPGGLSFVGINQNYLVGSNSGQGLYILKIYQNTPILRSVKVKTEKFDVVNEPNTTANTWNEMSQVCESKGKRLCSSKDLCPSNQPIADINIFGGKDNWMAVDDKPNEWLTYNTAGGRLCKTHTQVAGGVPGWGDSKGAANYYRAAKCCIKTVSKIMYGPWIGKDVPVATTRKLTTGETVYLIDDTTYTKMVTESGVAKYYVGKISAFNPNNWNTYSNAGSNYKIRNA
jgi:hypothetical protein